MGGIFAAYAGYLLSACYKPGMDFNYFMERLNIVTGKPFANYWNVYSLKAIVGAVFVYAIGMLMYLTSRRNYMPGKEFGKSNPVSEYPYVYGHKKNEIEFEFFSDRG